MVSSGGRIPLDGSIDGLKRSAARTMRRAVRVASKTPVTQLALAGVRTGIFLARSVVGRRVVGAAKVPEAPEPKLSLAVTLQVAMDECVMAVVNNPSRVPDPHDLVRVGTEVEDARALYATRGWLDDPLSFHADPPPLERPGVQPARWLGLGYERVIFESAYEPHAGEPGRDRWLAYEANRTGYAWVLRHRDGPRPWLVCLHGFGTGRAFMDFYAFRAAFLHHVLGLNLAIPVHPMHGPRNPGGFSGMEFMSHDLMNVVHGMAQSVWDTRRLIHWIQETQDAVSVGVYGVSLGGYLTALLGGVQDDLDCAISGIPISNLPELFWHHSPERFRRRSDSHFLLGDQAAEVLRVVSPLALAPKVAHDRRFLFAGLIDRMATPEQALRLWEHWERPRMLWYGGNHVGYMWSNRVDAFVQEALTSSLVTPRAA